MELLARCRCSGSSAGSLAALAIRIDSLTILSVACCTAAVSPPALTAPCSASLPSSRWKEAVTRIPAWRARTIAGPMRSLSCEPLLAARSCEPLLAARSRGRPAARHAARRSWMKLYWSAAVVSVRTLASGSAIGSVGTGRAAAASAFASRKELGAAPTGGEPGTRTGSTGVGGSMPASGSSVRGVCRVRMEPRSGAAASRAPSAPRPKRARRVAMIEVWSKGGRPLLGACRIVPCGISGLTRTAGTRTP